MNPLYHSSVGCVQPLICINHDSYMAKHRITEKITARHQSKSQKHGSHLFRVPLLKMFVSQITNFPLISLFVTCLI